MKASDTHRKGTNKKKKKKLDLVLGRQIGWEKKAHEGPPTVAKNVTKKNEKRG